MSDITVKIDKQKIEYKINIGSQNQSEFIDVVKNGKYSKTFIITDDAVARLHLAEFQAILLHANIKTHSITMENGENRVKNSENFVNLCEEIISHNIDRKILLIAFGGGTVGDLTGFIASVLLRGVAFIQVPTTLLSAVDSSVGGKTGINSKFGKNLIGSFYQPKFVWCNIDYLATLSNREFASGYAEILKYGMIYDAEFLEYLNQNIDKIIARNSVVLKKIIRKSCEIKAEIVGNDEKESGLRAILNFGHTLGHALEACTEYNSEILTHGEGVAIGMVFAAKLSQFFGMDISIEQINALKNHLKIVGLPTKISDIKTEIDFDKLHANLYKDKKMNGGKINFILLRKIGEAVIFNDYKDEDLVEYLNLSLSST